MFTVEAGPTVENLTLTPTTAYTNDTMFCNYDANWTWQRNQTNYQSDEGGDNSTINWYLNQINVFLFGGWIINGI